MENARDDRIFNPETAERFRAEANKCTGRWSRGRRFLNHLADILDGGGTSHRNIIIQSFGILLDPGTEQYWPVVREVCDAVPGVRWAHIEQGVSLGIRPSAAM